jgi:hypothetical protein
MKARNGLQVIVASLEREVLRLSRVQGTSEEGTNRHLGAAWSNLFGLLAWVRSPGAAAARHGTRSVFAKLRCAALLGRGLAARRGAPMKFLATSALATPR